MTARVDIKRVADAALGSAEALLREWLPNGHRDGHEWKALNPTRADSRVGSFSVNLNTGAWADFATKDKGGDLVALLAYLQAVKQGEAARRLAAKLGVTPGGASSDTGRPKPKRPEWDVIIPVPGDAPEPPKAHIKRGRPDASWPYRDRAGALLGVVYRFRTSDGGKEVLPCSFARRRDNGACEWRWLSFPAPRPLYGLDTLKADGPVLVVEGEKCADAAGPLLPDGWSVVTWPGGAKAVAKADWTQLQGRAVVLWPDCDAQRDQAGDLLPEQYQPGVQAMEHIAQQLVQLEPPATVRLVRIPAPGEKPGGWDVADAIAEGWSREQLAAFIHEQQRPPALSVVEATSGACCEQLLRNAKGDVVPCEHNAALLIEDDAQWAELHFDEFVARQRIGIRDYTDEDDLGVLRWLQAKHRVAKFTLVHARNAARMVAAARRRDSLRAFVDGLPAWDGVPRIEFAFVDAWGAADSPLIRAASRNFFVALIARARQPGAQVDTLWVFEAPQGSYKSRALRALGGEFHAEITAPIGTTDYQRELIGLWLAELAELESLRGREAPTVKRILSAPSDRFVQKFESYATTYQRRAVAVATTNEATYWQDSTGARRLIPVRCGTIAVDFIASNRLQWFAEAAAAHRAGVTWWEFPDVLDEQEARQIVDPWEDQLRYFMTHGRKLGADGCGVELWPADFVASTAIMRDWLGLTPYQQGAASGVRLGRVMRRLGYLPARRGKERERGWERAPEADTQTEVSAQVSAQVSAEIPL